MPKPAKSIEEIFPLIEYCKAGKLTEVAQWIKDGNPLDPPPAKRRSSRRMPLQIAIEKNFYSLAELLLKGGADPEANGSALDYCVWKGRAEIARLIIDHGVSPDSVDFMFVCEMGDPDMIRLLLEKGVDPTKDFAFYHAIIGKTKPALGIFKDWKDSFPDLREQLNAALLHFVMEGRARGAALCQWAGGDPAALAIDVASSRKEEWRDRPLIVAAWRGRLEILKLLRPEKYPDLLSEVLSNCGGGKAMIQYLLEIGAQVNGKPNGGSALLDRLIGYLGWDLGFSTKRDNSDTLDQIRYLVSKEARWLPDKEEGYRSIRSNFKNLSGAEIVEFVRILREGESATVEVFEELLKTPKMKEVVGRHRSEVETILHPPPPPSPADQVVEESKQQEVVRKVRKTPIAEVRKRTETFLLDSLCKRPSIPFWTRRISDHPPVAKTRRAMGLSNHDDRDAVEILKEAAARVEEMMACVEIQIYGNSSWGLAEVIFKLREGGDWNEALQAAWSLSGSKPNEHLLTDVGAKTLAWLQKPGSANEFIKERSLSHRMGLGGRLSDLEEHLKEIGDKTPKVVRWETRGDRRSDPPLCYKLWLEDREADPKPGNAWNPVLDYDMENVQKSELDQCRDRILDYLLEVTPVGKDTVPVVVVDSFKDLRMCFPRARFDQYFRGANLPGFFKRLKLPATLRIAYDFRRDAPFWSVEVYSKEDWETTLPEIVAQRNRPSLKQLYELSDEAASLLSWIEELNEEEMEYELSPLVNDELRKEFGIKSPGERENFAAYLQILIEEINEKTPWDLRVQPWKHYGSWGSRIRIRKCKALEESLIRQIQLYGLDQGKAIKPETIREKLRELVDPMD